MSFINISVSEPKKNEETLGQFVSYKVSIILSRLLAISLGGRRLDTEWFVAMPWSVSILHPFQYWIVCHKHSPWH